MAVINTKEKAEFGNKTNCLPPTKEEEKEDDEETKPEASATYEGFNLGMGMLEYLSTADTASPSASLGAETADQS